VGPFENLANPLVSLINVLFCGIGERFTVDGELLRLHMLTLMEIFPKTKRHAQLGVKMPI
jgi:hypothetical protein